MKLKPVSLGFHWDDVNMFFAMPMGYLRTVGPEQKGFDFMGPSFENSWDVLSHRNHLSAAQVRQKKLVLTNLILG